jgi:hypothetical protein
MAMALDDVHSDIFPYLLEHLGTSLPAACAACTSFARASEIDGSACFRSLCGFQANPSADASTTWRTTKPAREEQRLLHHAEVWRTQQGPSAMNWRSLAKAVHCLGESPCSWWTPAVRPCVGPDTGGPKATLPSHRHSLAICGVPGQEAALMFGGSLSSSMTGVWRSSADLFMVKLPGATSPRRTVNLWELPKSSEECHWPCSRWGASLTALQPASYLHGGWSQVQETDKVWALRLQEAGPVWSQCDVGERAPLSTAFHTATALEDGKRFALYGGLAYNRSHKGVWLWESDRERWSLAHVGGPSCAGHAAGVVGSRLLVTGGVDRNKLGKDSMVRGVMVFDLRAGRWDLDYPMRLSRSGIGPAPRRNPMSCTVGRHLLVSGGVDKQGASLSDTWVLDVESCQWRQLPGCHEKAPSLEGHKAVVSGMDVFALGGLSSSGALPPRSISVHALDLSGSNRVPEASESDGELEAGQEQQELEASGGDAGGVQDRAVEPEEDGVAQAFAAEALRMRRW